MNSQISKTFKITSALQATGLPLEGIYIQKGIAYGQYTRPLTKEEETTAQTILEAEYPEDEFEALEKQGYSRDQMLLTLWKEKEIKDIENKK